MTPFSETGTEAGPASSAVPAPDHCYVCGSPRVSLHQEVNGFSVFRCGNCRLLWVPESCSGQVCDLYNSGYFNSEGRIGYKNYLADEENIRRNSRSLLGLVSRNAGLEGRRVLDIGCAFGFLLDEARGGYGCPVFGTEISSEARTHAVEKLGLDVRDCDIPSCMFPHDFFDVVFLVGTIEHLTDPRKTLREIRQVLRPGGCLVITTIDTGGLFPFYMIKPPEHLFYFSRENLGRLLRESGFGPELRKTYFVSYFLHDLFHRLFEFSSFRLFSAISEAVFKAFPHLALKIPTNEMVLICRRNG